MQGDLFAAIPPNLPAPLPSETLYSWCGYVHLWNGSGSALETSRQLFGAPYAGLSHDFPSHLDTLVERTDGRLGQARALALNRTLLGYFLPFVDGQKAEQILTSLCIGAYPQTKAKLGILASQAGGHHPLKLCHTCIQNDRDQFGRTYWHIDHQYPGVVVCPRHSCSLHEAWDPTTPVHRRDWLLPEHGADGNLRLIELGPGADVALAHKLARFSAAPVSLGPAALDPQVLAWTYQRQLKARDLLTAGGNLRLKDLTQIVRAAYTGFEALAPFRLLRSVRPDWAGLIGALMRKHPKPGHPLKHLLLVAILFETWQDFLGAYGAAKRDPPQWRVARREQTALSTDPRIHEFVRLAGEQGLPIRQAARRVGVTTSTGVRWAKLHSISYTPRIKTLSPELLEAARQRLLDGATKQEVVERTGISTVSLTRLISSEPALRGEWLRIRRERLRTTYRQRFLDLVRDHPGLPVKVLRRIPGNGYQWLYRHDRQWLIENLPSLWKR